VDLASVPGPEAHTQDVALLHNLAAAGVSVRNPRLGLDVTLDFSEDPFRWVWLWRPYGGAAPDPYDATYALGVEPWTSPPSLANAIDQGQQRSLRPGEALSGRVGLSVRHVDQCRGLSS
jgi:galactose mutarotase-like enzyme